MTSDLERDWWFIEDVDNGRPVRVKIAEVGLVDETGTVVAERVPPMALGATEEDAIEGAVRLLAVRRERLRHMLEVEQTRLEKMMAALAERRMVS
jgi:hypothetical protein